MGRLCEWQLPLGEQPDEYNSFEQFRQRLQLQCRDGSPAYLRWTPDRNTPDLVYYQVRYATSLQSLYTGSRKDLRAGLPIHTACKRRGHLL